MKRNFEEAFGIPPQDDGRTNRLKISEPQATEMPIDSSQLDQQRSSTPGVSVGLESYHINHDGESAYALGPARVVHVMHEDKDVPAIILSWELSQQLQVAAQVMRQVNWSEHRTILQRAQLNMLEEQILARRHQLYTLVSLHYRLDPRTTKSDELKREIDMMDRRLEQIGMDRRFIDERHNDTAHRMFVTHHLIANAIEPMLRNCGLIQLVSDALPATHWDRAFDSRLRALDTLQDLSAEIEEAERYLAHSRWDRARREYQNIAQIAHHQYRHATQALREAERDFHLYCRREDYLVTHQPVFEASETASELDREALAVSQNLTRRLINAEDAVRVAKRNAVAVGFEYMSDDQTSISGCGGTQHVDVSAQRAPVNVMMDRDRIERWRHGVAAEKQVAAYEKADSEDLDLLSDEWAARSVAFREGVSIIAEGRSRQRVDEWRNACEGLHRVEEQSPEERTMTLVATKAASVS